MVVYHNLQGSPTQGNEKQDPLSIHHIKENTTKWLSKEGPEITNYQNFIPVKWTGKAYGMIESVTAPYQPKAHGWKEGHVQDTQKSNNPEDWQNLHHH